MKAVILCGGKGLRMGGQEVSKPLVTVGGMPILWHVMKIYKWHGFTEFVLCLGHNGDMIKRFYLDLDWQANDFRLQNREIRFLRMPEEWDIVFADTGQETMTGGRIKRIAKYIGEEAFMLTYGDGVSDINLGALLEFHRRMGKTATVTGVRYRSGYGILGTEAGLATAFKEKPLLDGWVNGGFFVLNPQVFEYIDGDQSIWEEEPMRRLVQDRELAVYQHHGFWHSVDTVKDVQVLKDLWDSNTRPWARWQGGN